MTHLVVVSALVGLSFLVALRLLPVVASLVRRPSTRWTSLGLLAFLLGGFFGASEFAIGGNWFRLASALVLCLGLLVPIAAREATPAFGISRSTAFASLLLTAWLFTVNVYENGTMLGGQSFFGRLVPSFLLVALLMARGRSPLDRRMFATLLTFSFAVSAVFLPFSSDPWRVCTISKCGVFDGMLAGPYSSENLMGMQAALVVALHLATFGLRRTVYLFPLGVLWLLATESRTSQYAFLAALTIAALYELRSRTFGAGQKSVDGVKVAVVAAFVPLLFIVLSARMVMTSAPDDFSGRGAIWMKVLAILPGREWTGFGIDRWEPLQVAGLLPANLHAHSIYVHLMFAGGLVAIALFAIVIRQSIAASARQDGALASGLVFGVSLLILGLLEVVWNPATIDVTTWVVIALVLTSQSSTTRECPEAAPSLRNDESRTVARW